MRLYLGSTFHTIIPSTVHCLPPIRPAIFLPFHTFVPYMPPAAPPIDPIERCDLECPWLAGCPLKPHLREGGGRDEGEGGDRGEGEGEGEGEGTEVGAETRVGVRARAGHTASSRPQSPCPW